MAESNSKPFGIVYCITNTVNKKQYVGQTTTDMASRWSAHKGSGSNCKALSSAIKKYGESAFVIAELAIARDSLELNALEAHYVSSLGTMAPNGYNLKEGGGSSGKWSIQMRDERRKKLESPEFRELMSINSKAMWQRPEVRKKISDAIRVGLSSDDVKSKRSAKAKESCNTPEVKARMSAAQKIRFQDPLQGEAISKRQRELLKDPAYRERIKITANKAKSEPAFRQKVSLKMKELWSDDDNRRKMVESIREGKARCAPYVYTEEDRKKISDAAKNRIYSPASAETKAKMSASQSRRRLLEKEGLSQ